ncbi:hypothetical protein THARTR1_00775 [Trichoderma harzianum]|uniref:Uncharacterized protein n=1 Tax=Trichoderma harzianum TaxID=5544 RepID=A0A2K0UPC9_TRIHA|nr:hypothetical protein THARTR1_00775 [Trichoderma harzianum]
MRQWSYKNQMGYRIYAIGNGEGRRNARMMPPLQYSNEGKVIILPGEIYCRWRGPTGRICQKNTAFDHQAGLYLHYRRHHDLEPERRTVTGFTYAYNQELDEWYTQVSRGDKPNWIPKKPFRFPTAAKRRKSDSADTTTPEEESP